MLRKSKKFKKKIVRASPKYLSANISCSLWARYCSIYLILSTQQPLTQCPFYQGKNISAERLSNLFKVTQPLFLLCSAAIIKLLQLSLTSPNHRGLNSTNS